MTELEELDALFRIGHMSRAELEDELRRIEEADPYGESRHQQSLNDMITEAKAVANVRNTESLMERVRIESAREAEAERRGERTPKRKKMCVTIDTDAYDRDSAYLQRIADRHDECKRLSEAVRGRLRHFEKRDDYSYQAANSTPLEAYMRSLEADAV